MTIQSLLADLQHRDVILAVKGDRLDIDAPRGTVSRELLRELAAHKNELIDLLNSTEPPEPNTGTTVIAHGSIKSLAVEIHAEAAGGRVWIVADEEDARLAQERLGVFRGETWTGEEIEVVARIKDPALAQEVAAWKRRFNGIIADESPAKSEPCK